MTTRDPITTLDPRYSEHGAEPTPWAQGRQALVEAELSWITTVSASGRPHVTPLLTVWAGESLHFCTGAEERKYRNLMENPRVVLTTGNNAFQAGLDLVVEGEAVRVSDDDALRHLTGAWEDKYGADWRFEVRDGAFHHAGDGGEARVFEVRPRAAFGFNKAPYSQTRWLFDQG